MIHWDLEHFEQAYQNFRAGEQTEETFREKLTEFSDCFGSYTTDELSEYLERISAAPFPNPPAVNIEEKSESPTRAIPCPGGIVLSVNRPHTERSQHLEKRKISPYELHAVLTHTFTHTVPRKSGTIRAKLPNRKFYANG